MFDGRGATLPSSEMISPRWTVVYQIHAKMVGHVVYEQIGGFAGLEKTDGIGAGEGVRAVDRVHRRQEPRSHPVPPSERPAELGRRTAEAICASTTGTSRWSRLSFARRRARMLFTLYARQSPTEMCAKDRRFVRRL